MRADRLRAALAGALPDAELDELCAALFTAFDTDGNDNVDSLELLGTLALCSAMTEEEKPATRRSLATLARSFARPMSGRVRLCVRWRAHALCVEWTGSCTSAQDVWTALTAVRCVRPRCYHRLRLLFTIYDFQEEGALAHSTHRTTHTMHAPRAFGRAMRHQHALGR